MVSALDNDLKLAKTGKLTAKKLEADISSAWKDSGNLAGKLNDLAVVKQVQDILAAQPSLASAFSVTDTEISYTSTINGKTAVEAWPLTGVHDPSNTEKVKGAVSDVVAPFKDVYDAIEKVIQTLFDPHFWIRALEIAVGTLLVGVGFAKLAGVSAPVPALSAVKALPSNFKKAVS